MSSIDDQYIDLTTVADEITIPKPQFTPTELNDDYHPEPTESTECISNSTYNNPIPFTNDEILGVIKIYYSALYKALSQLSSPSNPNIINDRKNALIIFTQYLKLEFSNSIYGTACISDYCNYLTEFNNSIIDLPQHISWIVAQAKKGDFMDKNNQCYTADFLLSITQLLQNRTVFEPSLFINNSNGLPINIQIIDSVNPGIDFHQLYNNRRKRRCPKIQNFNLSNSTELAKTARWNFSYTMELYKIAIEYNNCTIGGMAYFTCMVKPDLIQQFYHELQIPVIAELEHPAAVFYRAAHITHFAVADWTVLDDNAELAISFITGLLTSNTICTRKRQFQELVAKHVTESLYGQEFVRVFGYSSKGGINSAQQRMEVYGSYFPTISADQRRITGINCQANKTQEQKRECGRIGGTAAQAIRTPEQKLEYGSKGAKVANAVIRAKKDLIDEGQFFTCPTCDAKYSWERGLAEHIRGYKRMRRGRELTYLPCPNNTTVTTVEKVK